MISNAISKETPMDRTKIVRVINPNEYVKPAQRKIKTMRNRKDLKR